MIVVVSAALLFRHDGDEGSGIRGQVTGGCFGDGCHPIPKVGLQRVFRWEAGCTLGIPSAKCAQRPLPLVKKFRSAGDGAFRVLLPPGRYVIDQDPKSPAAGLMEPLAVTVREGEFTKAYVFYDNGYR
jgi:hypothetical protein